MPTHKRRPHVPSDVVSPTILETPDALVFQIRFTGEVFSLYDDYIERLNYYRERVWSCSRTGKSNLSFEEALVSERHAIAAVEQFPEYFHEKALRLIHHSTSGAHVAGGRRRAGAGWRVCERRELIQWVLVHRSREWYGGAQAKWS